MDEQKNSVPEQAEQPKSETPAEAQAQQTAAKQESQASEHGTTEQIDYKSELEKANLRIAELELECEKNIISKEWLIADGHENEVIEKAREMVKQGFAENTVQAVGMLKETMPDIINPNRMPKFSYSTHGGSFGEKRDTAFSTGLKYEKPPEGVGSRIREW